MTVHLQTLDRSLVSQIRAALGLGTEGVDDLLIASVDALGADWPLARGE